MLTVLFRRDEKPIGAWTLRVSDQNKEDEHGTFLGWTMSLWGSAIDPSKALPSYDVPLLDTTLPPLFPSDNAPSKTIDLPFATGVKQHPKPTEHLNDPGAAEGDADKPAFPGSTAGDIASPPASSPSSSATSTPTPDEGWFAELSNLMTTQVWFFVALGAVAIFGIAAGIFFWRRRAARIKNYSSLPTDSVPMSTVGGRPRTRELYDAFGEVSDDDDADEATGLRSGMQQSEGLTYHAGFLDDDPSTAGGRTPAARYKDEPDTPQNGSQSAVPAREREASPEGSGSNHSGDGSWEHASDAQR